MSKPILKLLENTLDYTTYKQKLISKNIANISTKNYRKKSITFDDFLNSGGNSQLRTTESKHISGSGIKMDNKNNFIVTEDKSDNKMSGYNNIDMDTEMADMAQNSILFRLAARRMNFYFSQLQTVIKGGR